MYTWEMLRVTGELLKEGVSQSIKELGWHLQFFTHLAKLREFKRAKREKADGEKVRVRSWQTCVIKDNGRPGAQTVTIRSRGYSQCGAEQKPGQQGRTSGQFWHWRGQMGLPSRVPMKDSNRWQASCQSNQSQKRENCRKTEETPSWTKKKKAFITITFMHLHLHHRQWGLQDTEHANQPKETILQHKWRRPTQWNCGDISFLWITRGACEVYDRHWTAHVCPHLSWLS